MGYGLPLADVARRAAMLLAYALSHLIPGRRGLWVFGADGGQRFAGNPKYLFLHAANEHADAVRPVWLSRDDSVVETLRGGGYRAGRATSLRGLYLTLRAEYVFVSHGPGDVAWWATGSTDVVQMWHGAPLKRIGGDLDRERSLPGRFFFRLTGSNWEHLLVTAERLGPIFSRAFRQPEGRILSVGYPRNDVLRAEIPDAALGDETVVERVRTLAADHPVAFYMPTWRDWGSGVEHGVPLTEAVDFERLDDRLAEWDAFLLVKLHPRERLDVDLDTLDRVAELPADADPYPLFEHVDVLATDYSSVYLDFLFLDRPVVFFPYDRSEYAERPGFYFPYDEVTPGPTPESFEAFCDALGDALAGADEYGDERETVRRAFFDHDEGKAAERLFRRLYRRSR